jgi:hypothetical protein
VQCMANDVQCMACDVQCMAYDVQAAISSNMFGVQ